MFEGDNCVEKALDFCLKLKGEERKTVEKKIFEYTPEMHAQNGSGFDLPCDEHIVGDII